MLVGEQLIFLLISLNLALADKRDPTYKGLQSQGVYEAVAEVESDQLLQTVIKTTLQLGARREEDWAHLRNALS